ncbi:hypothetical protein CH380_13700 [Leptospira adleri]|uniref:Uncharacterized protein n=1 Tax=Leptospira adleri TaxID=2023186 RepID=A0A2M9YML1_9LEPT|nr:hypothetical protein CH380_13700 [Leptospira adleri]PJZ60329.1 hypothetical protein CH376_19090 [Leptospira adleri]
MIFPTKSNEVLGRTVNEFESNRKSLWVFSDKSDDMSEKTKFSSALCYDLIKNPMKENAVTKAKP